MISHNFYQLNLQIKSETVQIFLYAEIFSDVLGFSEGAGIAQLPIGWYSHLSGLSFGMKARE